MAAKQWTLTDAEKNLNEPEFSLSPSDVPGAPAGFSVTKSRFKGGVRQGVDMVQIDNGKLRVAALPTRGMGLWRAWLGKLEIGWQSPVKGPVHPGFVPLMEPSGLGWLSGFDELLVRCGLESNGAPDFEENGALKYPLHGRIANRPAHHVELAIDPASGEIRLTGVVDETRFHFQKLRLTSSLVTHFGSPTLRIVDEVSNLSASPAEMQLLYHTNFGQPLLDPGAKVVVAAATIVPRDARAAEGLSNWDSYGNEQPGYAEQCYFLDLLADAKGTSHVLLKNAHASQGVSMRFPKKALPHFTVWKNTVAAADGYVTGLEPATNFPNPRSFESKQRRTVKLDGGGKAHFELELEVHGDAQGVSRAEQAIAKLQGRAEPKIFQTPQDGWTPGQGIKIK